MKHLMALILLWPLAAGAADAQDPRRIARLEKRVQRLEETHAQHVATLRRVYRRLVERLASPSVQEQERIVAELARVLEPVLAGLSPEDTGRTLRRAVEHIRKTLPEALSRLEARELVAVRDWLRTRLLTVIEESRDVEDVRNLDEKTWAQRALRDLLNDQMPFYLRWNAFIADALPETEEFTESYEALEKARQDLAIARDPLLKWRLGAPEGYAVVPSGNYQVNKTAGFGGGSNRRKPRRFSLQRKVYIGLCEVTVGEYFEWLKTISDRRERLRATPADTDGQPIWEVNPETGFPEPDPEALDLPVRGILLPHAVAFARARGARLPTEEEWCAMAGGPSGLAWPWGDEWKGARCNWEGMGIGAPQPVGTYEDGRGPFGHFDVAGNVAEWTMTYETGRDIDASDISDLNAVVRGGSYENSKEDVGTGWFWLSPARFGRDLTIGFRLARDPE